MSATKGMSRLARCYLKTSRTPTLTSTALLATRIYVATTRAPALQTCRTSRVASQSHSKSSRLFTSSACLLDQQSASKIYTFEEIKAFSSSPAKDRIIIDVREPAELDASGKIPGAINLPIKSAPDAYFLSEEDFEDRYQMPRPTKEQEVVFYCKAGVRSKAAAQLARDAGFGGRQAEFPGSWDEWFAKGGEVERK